MLPTLTFDESKNDTYTFTLWRDGKEVVHQFKGFSVTLNESYESVIHGASSITLHYADKSTLTPSEISQINGSVYAPVNESVDGLVYYIWVTPFQGDDVLIWLSKEEFETLDPILNEIKENLYYERYECEFTRTTLKDMQLHPEKYGPEQLRRAGIINEDDGNDECDYCNGAIGYCHGRCGRD